MKTLKEIAHQLKRIADSLIMIEMALLKTKDLKYPDIEEYAKHLRESQEKVNKE